MSLSALKTRVWLWRKGARHPTEPSDSPASVMQFFDAILRDDVKRVRRLLHGFPVDVSVRFGRTKRSLVHVAASVGAADSLGELHRAGWDVNCKDDVGVTPVHLAARNGHRRCLQQLVEQYGADVTVPDGEGFT